MELVDLYLKIYWNFAQEFVEKSLANENLPAMFLEGKVDCKKMSIFSILIYSLSSNPIKIASSYLRADIYIFIYHWERNAGEEQHY